MPAPPTHIAAPRLTGEALKLRSSCDHCGTAKVKCDRGQPQCGRCISLRLICVYGPSRKFGKPPRKRPRSDRNMPSTSILSYKRHNVCSTESRDNHTMGFSHPHRVSESAQLSFPDLANDTVPLSADVNTTLSVDGQNQLGSPFFYTLPLQMWPELDSLEAGLEIPSILHGSTLESRHSAPTSEPVSTVTSTDKGVSHSCPRDSYEIIRDLICPAPFLHAPEASSDTVSAQLDHVLHFTRNAIARLSRVLKCPCSKSGHRVMVHASIISRILIWYQQAAGWTGDNSRWRRPSALAASSTSSSMFSSSSPRSRTADSDTSSPPSLVQTTGFAVENVPIVMGTFNIEDQIVLAAFRNQLILSELKNTVNLIDLFTSQDSCESSTNGVATLYSALGAWLRSELSRTVQMLKSRLSELNEDMSS
jgi:hypothetical protein